MTESAPEQLANAAANCLLRDLTDAGLDLIPSRPAASSNIHQSEAVQILYLGCHNDNSASELLVAISEKGLGVAKDFAHISLLQKDPVALESALSNYSASIIIVLGAENALQLFPGVDSPTKLPRGALLNSNYTTIPILITESLNAMLSNPELKKTCWKDLQLAKEILNNCN